MVIGVENKGEGSGGTCGGGGARKQQPTPMEQ